MKIHSKEALLCVGYGLMEFLQRVNRTSALNWSNYHDFPIATVPSSWVHPFLSSLGIDPGDITIQIGECKANYRGKSHFHKIGHQLVIALGEKEGFRNPTKDYSVAYPYIYIAPHSFEINVGEAYYFPTNIPHNFRGEFFFINIQNPPLIIEGNDDYFEV